MDALWSDVGLVAAVAAGALGTIAYTRSRGHSENSGVRTTALRGPPRESWLVGQTKAVWGQSGVAEVLENWADTYGRVYLRPGPLGSWDILVLDPKAAASLFARSEEVYHVHKLSKTTIESLLGRGLISADGESHKRQRKSISPGFTSVKIREYSTVFYDCAHKLASQWDSLTESTGEYVGDVQVWLNALSLDTIGRAGFSYDFGSLSGRRSDITAAFEDLASATLGIGDGLIFVLQPTFPWASKFPTQRQRAVYQLKAAAKVIAQELMKRTKEEKEDERSIMGLLNKAETARTGATLTESEVQTQITTLLVAGYETTSTTLTWILIELCRHPHVQDRLRKELLAAYPSSDPEYDELMTGLPYLDAVVHESLRLHVPISESWRTAMKDDILPLSEPITLPDGSVTDKIVIAKGTPVAVNEEVLNRSKALWGEDAWDFRPERWLEGVPKRAQEIAGYRHLMTFLDGPKVCLGRSFAVANIKVALAIVMRKFAFELPGGPKTKFEAVQTAVLRVKTEGEKGCKVSMRISRID